MYERERAIAKFASLKKELYQLGVQAGALINDIQDETETFLSEKDFSTIDFNKVVTLSKAAKKLQEEYLVKLEEYKALDKKYNLSE